MHNMIGEVYTPDMSALDAFKFIEHLKKGDGVSHSLS